MTRKHFDEEVKKRVQAVEQDIPMHLEKMFTEELDRFSPLKRRTNRALIWGLATAASFLLVAFLTLTVLFRPVQTPITTEKEVVIDYATVEGQPATTYIVNQQSPDLTIIWIEKTTVVAMNSE